MLKIVVPLIIGLLMIIGGCYTIVAAKRYFKNVKLKEQIMFLVHWLSIMALHWFHDDPCWNICTLSNVQLKLSCRKNKDIKITV